MMRLDDQQRQLVCYQVKNMEGVRREMPRREAELLYQMGLAVGADAALTVLLPKRTRDHMNALAWRIWTRFARAPRADAPSVNEMIRKPRGDCE